MLEDGERGRAPINDGHQEKSQNLLEKERKCWRLNETVPFHAVHVQISK
jgi:hypothetical protein